MVSKYSQYKFERVCTTSTSAHVFHTPPKSYSDIDKPLAYCLDYWGKLPPVDWFSLGNTRLSHSELLDQLCSKTLNLLIYLAIVVDAAQRVTSFEYP